MDKKAEVARLKQHVSALFENTEARAFLETLCYQSELPNAHTLEDLAVAQGRRQVYFELKRIHDLTDQDFNELYDEPTDEELLGYE